MKKLEPYLFRFKRECVSPHRARKHKTDIVFHKAQYTHQGEADDADLQKIPEESDIAWND